MTEKENNPQKSVISRGWLCEKCGKELATHDEYKQHKVNHQLGKSDEVEEQPVQASQTPKKTDRLPIQLTYLWKGNCQTCGKTVDTLEIDVGEEHYCIAFCTACKTQKSQRKVVKL